jgi:hypothetical protein
MAQISEVIVSDPDFVIEKCDECGGDWNDEPSVHAAKCWVV